MDRITDNSLLPEDVLDNLRLNSRELYAKFAKRHFHLRELARFSASEADPQYGAALPESSVDAFNSYKEFNDGIADGLPVTDRLYDKGCFELTDVLSDAVFCREAGKGLSFDGSEAGIKQKGARICYFRNHFSDRAFLSFSKYLPESSADYTHDFTSACEGVYYGKYDYCILPSDSYTDGQMTRILSLMQKYELYIVLSCRIYSGDGDEFISFYLLSAGLDVPSQADRIAVTVIPDSSYPLWKILCGAEQLGAVCKECTSLPEKMFSEKAYFTVLDITNADMGALCAYFQLALNEYSVEGIYREIK